MNGSFEVLIPEGSNLDPFEFKSPMFVWQGVNYPQGLPECKFGSNFQLKMLEYYDIPDNFKDTRWIGIEILGDGLDIFVDGQNGFSSEEDGYSLRDLLTNLLDNKIRWIVIYSHEYDGYSRISSGDIDDVLLNWKEASEGFMIYK